MRTTPPIALRTVEETDEPFLFELFRGANEDLQRAPLDEPLKRTLFETQFAAQRRGYLEQYPEAEHRILTVEDRDVGRVLVARTETEIRLVDLCLLPDSRGAGIGSSMLGLLLDEARRSHRPLRLSVRRANPARRLYERLGFATLAETATHVHMVSVPG